jgi:hypothetical protein
MTLLRVDDGANSVREVEVAEDFDECLNKLFPLEQENSALAARGNTLWTIEETGKRFYCPRGRVLTMEEQ